jgi:hypothetical protein
MSRQETIVSELTRARARLHHILAGAKGDDWDRQVQDEDQHWTVRQVVIHLTDAQRGMFGQMRKIAAGEEAIPADFDLNRWNRRTVEKNADKIIEELLMQLASDHDALKAFVTGLTDAELDRRGRHSSLEIMSVEEIARLVASHEMMHAETIAAALA